MRLLHILSLAAFLASPLAACGDDTPSDTTDTSSPDTTAPDTVTPDAAQPDAAQPDTSTPDTTQPPQDTQTSTCTDDSLAGTIASPADLSAVSLSDTFTICPGVADYFSVTAEPGDVLKITLVTQGVAPDGTTDPGVNDLDMYLYQGSVSDPNLVAGAETAAAIEQIVFTVDAAGTYILEVLDYEGSNADYTLVFNKAVGCATDADCDGDDICYVGIDDANLVLAQECQSYSPPSCGQGAEDTANSSHSDSTAVSFDALATDGSFTASICGADVDVFSLDLEAGDSLVGAMSATLPADSILLATLVDGDGGVVELFILETGDGSVAIEQYFLGAGGTYYLYVDYLTPAATATDDLAYTLTFDVAKACLLDSDCDGELVCGQHAPANVPTLVCAPYKADACGDDDDSSQTNATALTSGVEATGGVCAANPDYYTIELTEASSDLSVSLTWTGAADLELYLFAPDGTPYGAGWYGNGIETVTGRALPPGTYFLLVEEWVDDPNSATTTATDYSLTATVTPGTACTSRTDCKVGGTQDSDATAFLSCDGGVCGGVGAGLLSQQPGAACASAGSNFAGLCAGGSFCFFGVSCVTTCTEGGQAACDDDFGGTDIAYCETGYWSQGGTSIGLCVPYCDSPTPDTHLWGDAECAATYETSCVAGTNRCLQQQ